MSEWKKVEGKIDALSINKRDVRAFTRFFFSAAQECEFDKQGRINIPSILRNYAKIEKKKVCCGRRLQSN